MARCKIDDSVKDAVQLARAEIPAGESRLHCELCDEEIPEARRRALPGVRTCVPCQSGRDTQTALTLFNRRGSKDSQMR